MTTEEIRKMAESLCPTNNPTMDDVWLIEDIIEGILRSHYIVEKSKVRKAFYNATPVGTHDRFGTGYNLGVIETLESLFSPDTFDETDK